ncbi:J domain-containing protein [Tahibacter amnicola]|uniref:J domain-containing protein n=1 Tax=Tahibacter amnicola TaxID=2976241 RepID=A0ABY6B9N5_9GAMM|nr:J domain-containing protein [Tahibacter amnicola]UXI66739.1 J domain-containing protein [Tahibacter amnicola]
MQFLQFLGLDASADERTIRRAYAVRLKRTRPDEDPQGFQRLHEAYQAALRWSRERMDDVPDSTDDEEEADDASTSPGVARIPHETLPAASAQHTRLAQSTSSGPTPSTSPADGIDVDGLAAPPPAPEAADEASGRSFDFGAYFDDLRYLGNAGDAQAMADWLNGQPVLWSLQAKAAIGQVTIRAIREHGAPMPRQCYDVLLRFFGFDQVLGTQDAMMLKWLGDNAHVRWCLTSPSQEPIVALTGLSTYANRPLSESAYLRGLLARPFTWATVLTAGLRPFMPSRTRRFLLALGGGLQYPLSPPLDTRQIGFWLRAGDTDEMSPQRLAIGASRAGLLTVCLLLLALIYPILPAKPMVAFIGVLGVAFVGGWAALALWSGVTQWQNAPQSPHETGWQAALRLAFIPLLAGTGALATHSGAPELAAGILAFGLAVAIVRFRRRAGYGTFHLSVWMLFLLIPLARVLAGLGAFLYFMADAGAAVVLAIWAVDAWKHRLRARTA